METYTQYLDNAALCKKHYPQAEIFYYKGDEFEDLYKQVCSWAFESLAILNDKWTHLSQITYVIIDELSENAKAGLSPDKDVGFILINKGYIKTFFKCLTFENNIFDSVEFNGIHQLSIVLSDLFVDVLKQDKVLYSYLFKNIFQFSFYHEFAHIYQLIQRDRESEEIFFLEEEKTSTVCYNEQKHLYELDADLYATRMIFEELYVLIKKYMDLGKDERWVEHISAICYASIIIYFMRDLSLPGKGFYTKKGRHPHDIIRINNILHEVARIIITQIEKGNFFKYNPDLDRIISLGDYIADTVLKKTSTFQPLGTYFELVEKYVKYSNDIWGYLTEMRMKMRGRSDLFCNGVWPNSL